jgi:hypothetical protein
MLLIRRTNVGTESRHASRLVPYAKQRTGQLAIFISSVATRRYYVEIPIVLTGKREPQTDPVINVTVRTPEQIDQFRDAPVGIDRARRI